LPDASPRIVLDTNVLYAGLYSNSGKSFQLLSAIAESKVRIALSTPLLFEYEDVLKRNQTVLNLNDMEVDAVLDNLCASLTFKLCISCGAPVCRTPRTIWSWNWL
jgi:predicted nucleic acid-binding protein